MHHDEWRKKKKPVTTTAAAAAARSKIFSTNLTVSPFIAPLGTEIDCLHRVRRSRRLMSFLAMVT